MDETTSTGDVSGAQQVSETASPTPQVSERRRKLYRIPLLGGIVYLIAPPRTGPPSVARRAISWTSVVALFLGVAMLAYPVAGHRYPFFLRVPVEKAIEWSNIFSDMESNRIQERLAEAFGSAELAERYRSGNLIEGDPITRMQIPKIGVDTIVVFGITDQSLKAGAGLYPQTPLPGSRGNTAIAGHRTTYGRPFNRVDELVPGDKMVLTTPVGIFTYEIVQEPWITHPRDWSVIDQSTEPLLTLTTCHPKGSDRQRMIARAKLVSSEPVQRAHS